MVTATARTFKSLSIQPPVWDSPVVAVGSIKYLTVAATDSSDLPLSGLSVKYTLTNPAVLRVLSGPSLYGVVYGKTKIIASTTSYGVTRSDTVEYAVKYATTASVYLSTPYPGSSPLYPIKVYIGVGGTVTWWNYSTGSGAITFDNGGANIPDGNIASIGYSMTGSRTFPIAGVYQYKDAYGTVAVITVLENE